MKTILVTGGCGLIGSSILRAANNKKLSQIVSVYDKSNDVLRFLKNQKLTNHATDDIKIAVKNSELTIISSPLSAYKEIISKIDISELCIVSKADINTENIMKNLILQHRPNDTIIGEENIDVKGSSGFSWIIDPIDGTRNFINGINKVAIMLSFIKYTQCEFAIIYDPINDVFYHTHNNHLKYLKIHRIHLN